MNILKVLSSYSGRITETNISAILAYLLDPSADHGIGYELVNQFIRVLCRHEDKQGILHTYLENYSDYDIVVRPEFRVDVAETGSNKTKRVIDIVLKFYKSDENTKNENTKKLEFLVGIENKISDASLSDLNQVYDEIYGLHKNYNETKNKSIQIFFILICPERNEKIDKSFQNTQNFTKNYILWKEKEGEDSIINMITTILKDESIGKIDPLSTEINYILRSFISFVNNNFQSKNYKDEIKNEKINYGKPIREYLKDIYNQLLTDKEYHISDIQNRLSSIIKKQSGEILNSSTRYLQIRKVIVNDFMRIHHNVRTPFDNKINLFYYVDRKKRDIIKKFDMDRDVDIEIYWVDEGKTMCKTLSELKNHQ